jgi:hypothetical protein
MDILKISNRVARLAPNDLLPDLLPHLPSQLTAGIPTTNRQGWRNQQRPENRL